MSEKRRDNKKRLLRTGESQRKDGRYVYKYLDNAGNPQCVYAWKLDKNDRTPQGKREDLSLREKERQIKKDLEEHIAVNGGNVTVVQLVEKYVNQKRGVKYYTKQNYQFVFKLLKRDEFGNRRIDTVKLSDAREWCIKLQDEGMAYATIGLIRSVLRPAFDMAVEDDLIRKNPFLFTTKGVLSNDKKKREALSSEEEIEFLNFINNDKRFNKYYDAIFLLLNTGLRISEMTGLTISDLDFKEKIIHIDHQLLCTSNGEYHIVPPKSLSGIRDIPMTVEVYACLKRIIASRTSVKVESIIDGKSRFLFLNEDGTPKSSMQFQKVIQRISEKYEKSVGKSVKHVSAHILRHTFCTKMANLGMKPKSLQYIMGHSSISMTMDVYTHSDFSTARVEMLKAYNE